MSNNAERLSPATSFNPETSTLTTREQALLSDGMIDRDHERHYEGFQVIGEKNWVRYTKTLPDDYEHRKLGEELAECHRLERWHRHILGREVAVRAVEASLISSDLGLGDIQSRLADIAKETGYDRSRPFGKKPISLKSIVATADVALSEGWSLGDLVASERLRAEEHAIVTLGILTVHLLDQYGENLSGAITPKRDVSRRVKDGKHVLNAGQGTLLQCDLGLIKAIHEVNSMAPEVVSGEGADCYAAAKSFVSGLVARRVKITETPLDTSRAQAKYVYIPSNMPLYEANVADIIKLSAPRPVIEVRSAEDVARLKAEADALRLAQKANSEAAKQERLAAEEARTLETEAHDQPIIEELDGIAGRHNTIIDRFVGQTSKSLRGKFIIGKDSLEFRLNEVCRDLDSDFLRRIVKVYSTLLELANQYGDDCSKELTEQLLELERLSAGHDEYRNSHRLKGNSRFAPLSVSVKPELNWLGRNFEKLEVAIASSRHQPFFGSQTRGQFLEMLGIEDEFEGSSPKYFADFKDDFGEEIEAQQEFEEPAEAIEDSEVDLEDATSNDIAIEQPPEESSEKANPDESSLPTLSPLESANRLAEQLSWVILPDAKLTADDLVGAAKTILAKKCKESKSVEAYRMEALLTLRDKFGGELYRSDERTLGDNDNLYFVLRFKQPDDGRWYAVAENPVYGNATYVLREDTLPLQPGETLLAALKLYRKDVAELGARRIVHGAPNKDTHFEKVSSQLSALAKFKS